MILTDESGVPIEAPVSPGFDATVEEKISYIRARHAYNDRVTSVANRAFDAQWKKEMKHGS